MIVCSCTVISDRDIEAALLEILNQSGRTNPELPASSIGICKSA